MKKLSTIALALLAAAAVTGCANTQAPQAAAQGTPAKKGGCCGEKSADAKAAAQDCGSGEAKASGACSDKAAQVK